MILIDIYRFIAPESVKGPIAKSVEKLLILLI